MSLTNPVELASIISPAPPNPSLLLLLLSFPSLSSSAPLSSRLQLRIRLVAVSVLIFYLSYFLFPWLPDHFQIQNCQRNVFVFFFSNSTYTFLPDFKKKNKKQHSISYQFRASLLASFTSSSRFSSTPAEDDSKAWR